MKKNIITLFSIGAILAFIIGSIQAVMQIMANRYVFYQLYRLIPFSFKNCLNKSVYISFVLVIILLVLLSLKRIIWKPLFSDTITIHIINENKVKLLLVCIVCFALFFYAGWTISIRLPYVGFHPVNLLSGAGALLITMLLGWASIKLRWKKLFNNLITTIHKRNVIIVLGLIIFLVLINLAIIIDKKINAPKEPNVIVISIDTLRADHLSCYGYGRQTSPNIDKFASDSFLFENCYAQAPVTGASITSILSGFLPHETGVRVNNPVSADVVMLAEILRAKGYSTIGVVSNYILKEGRGWEQGFEIYNDTMKQRETVRSKVPERTAEFTTAKAIELLRKHKDQPLFMWVHFQDPHGPYTPPDEFAKTYPIDNKEPVVLGINKTSSGQGGIPSYQQSGKNRNYHYYVSQYDAEIHYMDDQIEKLISEIKELGLYEESLIIFSADHGEGMGEHDYYFAHGDNLYSDLIHVPLIVRAGNRVKGRSKNYVQQIDIMPTVLNFLGIKINFNLRGLDLLKKTSINREIFSEMETLHERVKGKFKFSLIIDGMKLIYTPYGNQYELYDLRMDSKEKNNLINQTVYNSLAAEMQTRLHQIRKENFLKIRFREEVQKTEDEIEKLKSLGYVQ